MYGKGDQSRTRNEGGGWGVTLPVFGSLPARKGENCFQEPTRGFWKLRLHGAETILFCARKREGRKPQKITKIAGAILKNGVGRVVRGTTLNKKKTDYLERRRGKERPIGKKLVVGGVSGTKEREKKKNMRWQLTDQ